jgi:hypothetical protein
MGCDPFSYFCLLLRTAFIRFLTQLITAIILVGPNPVGLVVSAILRKSVALYRSYK